MTTASPVDTGSAANPEALVLVKFHWDCGRMGDVRGMFVTTKAQLEAGYDREVYFGEILGKHSEVYGKLERGDIEIVTEDQAFLQQLVKHVGTELGGYNPLSYFREDKDEDDNG